MNLIHCIEAVKGLSNNFYYFTFIIYFLMPYGDSSYLFIPYYSPSLLHSFITISLSKFSTLERYEQSIFIMLAV